jgi:hypothetical protein
LPPNLIVKSQAPLTRHQPAACRLCWIIGWDVKGSASPVRENDIKGRIAMPSRKLSVSRTPRCDVLVASAVLVALIAGWVLNFVSAKPMAVHLDSMVGASTRAA